MSGASARRMLRDAARMTARDWRAGELTLLLVALLLAVAALTSVSFVADRMRLGLEREATQMLGADLRIRGDQPLDPVFTEQARARGLRTAATTVFPSMVAPAAGGAAPSRLAAVKAVSTGYPLRGELRIAPGPGQPDRPVRGIPAAGTVWVDAPLLDALHLRVGQALRVGKRDLRIAAIITRELDRGVSFINFSPRVMLRVDDLASTGLIGYGSRVNYRLLVAGAAPAVEAYTQWAHATVDGGKRRGIGFESLDDGQPQVRETLDRARHFLTLVAMLTALLAAVAIAMACHRFTRRHLDGCAVMRCLGASEATLRVLFALEFLLVGLVGGAVGVALGFAGHLLLLALLGDLVNVTLPPPSVVPAAQGLAMGLVLLLGFALPPLLPLTRVPPIRVLRRAQGVAARPAWGAYAVGAALFAGLLVVGAGEVKLGAIVAGGCLAGVALFSGFARLALWLLARLARHGGAGIRVGWRYALASLERRHAASVLQTTALGIGLMCLLLLALTRNDLIAGWRKATPANAADHFIIDIQPDQAAQVTQILRGDGMADAALAPMVRGRLLAVNGKTIDPDAYQDNNARRLVDREFNLSYTAALPADNRIVAGQWFGGGGRAEISLEQGIAKTLGIKLGDTLRFGVAERTVDAPVTSLRKLDWGTFRVNFFVLMPPATLSGFPSSFITSFKLPDGGQAKLDALVARFPNLTVIDVRAVLAQLQRVLGQVISAVQFLFAFALAAGVLVVYAALAGSRDERVQEAALLRALGASQRQIREVQVAEFVTVGALAGVLAALGAQAIGGILATRVFDFHMNASPWLLPVGVLAGVGCAALGGMLSTRRVLQRPALQSLRDA